jgi:hypothetical protein
VFFAALRDGSYEPGELDIEEPQRRLRDWCEGKGVPCLDLLPFFQVTTDAYAPCDTHWNVHGNRIAAREIAGWLPTQVRSVSPQPPIP